MPHFSRTRFILAASIASVLVLKSAQAATYTYSSTTSNTSGTATTWSAGTFWAPGVPVSAADTTLTFGGASLLASQTLFTSNDFAGNFLLNKLNFTYAGPSTGTAPSFTISGNALEFVSDGVTTPVLTINPGGTSRSSLTINNDLVLTNDLLVAASGSGVFNGALSGGGALTKSGAGTLVLNGNNSYAGPTTINGGVLRFGAAGSVPAGMVSINAGAALSASGPAGFTSAGDWLGSGRITAASAGALALAANDSSDIDLTAYNNLFLGATGAFTYSGSLTAGSNGYRLGGGGGTLTVSSQLNAATTLTTGGNVTLTNANAYTGVTNVGTGSILNIQNSGALGSNPNVILNATTTVGAGLALQGGIVVAGKTLTGAGTDASQGGGLSNALANVSGNNEWAGAIVGNTTNGNFRFSADGGNLLISGTVSFSGGTGFSLVLTGTSTATISDTISSSNSTSIIKNGASVWTLSGSNTYTGVTRIDDGVLLLMSANALPGGTGFTGGTSNVLFNLTSTTAVLGLGAGDFTRGLGSGVSQVRWAAASNGGFAAYGADRIVNLGGLSAGVTWGSGSFVATGQLLVLGAASADGMLDFQNPINFGTAVRTVQVNNGTAAFDAKLSGNLTGGAGGGLTKAGSGTLVLTGTNTYLGTTTLTAGGLVFNSAGALAGGNLVINGGGFIGLGAGDFTRPLGTGDGAVRWTGGGGFAAFGADRIVNLGGASAGVSWAAGDFVPNASSLVLGAASADAMVDFQNPINLAGATRTVQVDDGTAAIDAKLSGVISGATAADALTKTGAGTVLVSGDNSYAGLTTVSNGVLKLGHANALGTTAAGVTVATGGTVDLNGQAIGAETFSLAGAGAGGAGALINTSATAVTLAGQVSLAAGSTVGGSGDISLTLGLSGNSALTKIGAGTFTLGADAISRTSGGTTINGGTVVVTSNNGLGASTTANNITVTVNNAATLEIRGASLALDNGVGITVNNGATVRSNGSNTINGRILVPTAVGANSVTIATTNAGDVLTLGNGSSDVSGGNGTDDVIRITGPGTVRLGQTSNYVGNWSLESGVTQLGAVAALGATPASTVTLMAGATLAGRLSATNTFTANPIIVAGTGIATLLVDRSSSGAGVNYTFGTLSIGGQQLDVTHSAAVISGTSTVILGAAGASNTLTGNAIFNVSGAQRVDLNLVGLDESGGSYGFTKNGNGNLALTSVGTSYNYSGPVVLNAGGLFINRADALGTGTLTINGGSLDRSAGPGEVLTTNNVQFWNGSFSFVGTNALNLGSGGVTLGASVTVTTSANLFTVGGDISDGGNGYGLTKAGAGTMILTGTNTYSGATVLSGGLLRVTHLANGGMASNIGQSSNAASNLVLNGGRFEYLGDGDVSDRLFDLASSTTLSSSGSGALVFNNGGANTTSGAASARILTLAGYNLDENTIAGSIGNSGTSPNVTSVVKHGSGTWVLGGANAFSGTTTARGGTLIFDYASADPLGTSGIVLDGGNIVLRAKPSGTTVETVSSLTLGQVNGVDAGFTVDSNGGAGVTLTIATLVGIASSTLQSSLIDISSSSANTVAVTNVGAALTTGGGNVLLNSTRANVIVRNASGYGFATLSGGVLGRLATGTTLTETNTSATGNFFYSTPGLLARTAALNYQTLTVDSTAGDITIDFGTNNFAPAGNGRGVLIQGGNDVTISGTGNFGTAQWFFNYGTGDFLLSTNLTSGGNLYLGGTGFTSFGGSIDLAFATLNIIGGLGRLTLDQTISTGAGGIWVSSGGVLELGADLNAASPGDFSHTVGTAAGGLRFFGDAGLSAFTATPNGTRIANLSAGAALTWGSGAFLTNSDGTTDGEYTLKLSSIRSNATIELQNGIALNGRNRVIEVANGSADVDARLTGVISGTAVGFTKTGAGTLALTGASTYNGATNVDAGTLVVSGSLGGTIGGRVAAGATLNVTGTGSINAASTFEVSGTMNVVDVTSSAGAVKVNDDGVLEGNGTVGALVVANGGTISPGNSVGALHAGSTIFQAGGTLKLELATDGTTGVAGTDWDKLAVDATGASTLDLTSLTSGSQFILKLEAGALPGWDALVPHRWESIITTTGGFVGGTFSSGLFAFDTSDFDNTIDTDAFFRVEQNGNNVDLVYVPEPGSAVSLMGGLSLLLGLQRFRRRTKI